MNEFKEEFARVKILVFGDLMLDKYLSGRVDRISPEAPVPILKVDSENTVPGGAANVAANVVGLGAIALVSGMIGADPAGDELIDSLQSIGADTDGVFASEKRPTTIKTRLITQHHQLGRFDREVATPLSEDECDQLWSKLEPLIGSANVVLVSDYAKGAVNENVLARLITKANSLQRPVFADPKGLDFSKYRQASLLTPNEKEALDAAEFLGYKGRDALLSGRFLMEKLELSSLIITLGEKGMLLFTAGKDPVRIGAEERKVFDVTGAGDTVISTLAVAFAAGASVNEAARMANYAAGVVVERLGTTAINFEALASFDSFGS